jgi:hypothetical protein
VDFSSGLVCFEQVDAEALAAAGYVVVPLLCFVLVSPADFDFCHGYYEV